MNATRSVNQKRLESIKIELESCIGSFVAINGERWYVGNIFDLPGNRKSYRIGAGMRLVRFAATAKGDEHKSFRV